MAGIIFDYQQTDVYFQVTVPPLHGNFDITWDIRLTERQSGSTFYNIFQSLWG